MILEHSFITTRPEGAILTEALALLAALEFEPEYREAPGPITARRGALRARKARDQTELPQRVRIAFDRGLVTLAMVMEVHGKERDEHRSILLALAGIVEGHLGRCEPLAALRAEWDAIHDRLRRKARVRRRIIAGALMLLIGGLVFLIVVAAINA